MKTPGRGNLIVMDFNPQAGHEQMKRRPALVLSTAAFNDAFKMAYVAPITTKPRGNAFEIPLSFDSKVTGVILMHQVKSLDWQARRARFAGTASANVVASAIEILREIFGGD